MAYFIFDRLNNSLLRIYENDTALNNTNMKLDNFDVVSVSEDNFLAVKYNQKDVVKNGDILSYTDIPPFSSTNCKASTILKASSIFLPRGRSFTS